MDGDYWSTTPSHTDGEALWETVCELGLEGVVAKKRSGHYLPGRRGWIKTKNRAYWRYPLELEATRSYPADPSAASTSHSARSTQAIQARWRGSSSGGC